MVSLFVLELFCYFCFLQLVSLSTLTDAKINQVNLVNRLHPLVPAFFNLVTKLPSIMLKVCLIKQSVSFFYTGTEHLSHVYFHI